MLIDVIDQPAAEPLSRTDVYDQLRLGVGITEHIDDRQIDRLIRAARQATERWTRRALIDQRLRLTIDAQLYSSRWNGDNRYSAPGGILRLPRPCLLEVVAVQFYDADNVLRSVDLADYRVVGIGNTGNAGGYVEFSSSYSAEPVFARSDACSVVFRAGYPPGEGGETEADDLRANVPEELRDAMLLMVDRGYNTRTVDEDKMVDDRLAAILEPYRVTML